MLSVASCKHGAPSTIIVLAVERITNIIGSRIENRDISLLFNHTKPNGKRIIFRNQLSSGGFRLPILMKIESRMARYPCNFQVFRRIGIVIRSFHSFLTSPNFFHFFDHNDAPFLL